jgi:Sulfotransferase family
VSEPTIVCVVGMHRSGTSLVAQLLHALGLDLGPEEHLMRPSTANPAGHWENEPINEINDEILARLGGNWSEPPELPANWERSPELDDLRQRAREVIQAEFAGSDRWGFKDPRTSLTLPFWQHLLPPMRYVICLRNPVDVAFSLKARQEEPLPFEKGVELWLTHMRSTLAATAAHPQHFIFYEDLMVDPEPLVRGLAGFIGNDESDAAEAYARAAIRVAMSQALWHHRTPVANVIDEPRLPFPVKALYLAVRLFAQGGESVTIEAVELLGRYADDADRERADLERRLSERRADLHRAVQSRRDAERRTKELEAQVETARKALELARGEVRRLRAETRPGAAETGTGPTKSSDGAYRKLVEEVRARALELIPAGATVLVGSKGDDRLLRLEGRRGWHFPSGPDGRYLGYHPAGDTAAIAQLEAMRARGADHLVLPATVLWWLEHYRGLRSHLDERCVQVFRDERCAIYRLDGRVRPPADDGVAALKRAIACVRIRSGRTPSVLDWGTELGIGDQFPEIPVFVPPGEGDALPYLDRTFDIVVVSAHEARLAEARRVAASAVISVARSSHALELAWLPGAPSGWGEDVSVVLTPDSEPAWDATVTALAETLNEGFAGELCVIGPAATLTRAGERAAAAGAQVQLIEAGASISQRARTAVKTSGRRRLVFVTAPAVPIGDWLPPMLSLFSSDQSAGVVGTRILSPIGELEEAGGILAPDGSPRRRGEGDQNPDRHEYRFVKRVDFCSRPLLATRKDVFERLKGFDDAVVAPADALAEFSLRAGRTAAPVYYQPEARMVRI